MRRDPQRTLAALLLSAVGLAACSGDGDRQQAGGPPSARSSRTASAVPINPRGGYYKIGKPYQINGRWYRPKFDPDYRRTGVASWYGAQFHGLATANGEIFDKEEISAAHPTLPLPSVVRVVNLENDRSILVRVNDRGPFVDDRLIDLSQAAARELGYEHQGLARVRVEFVEISDDARGSRPAPTTVASLERTPLESEGETGGEIVRARFVTTEAGAARERIGTATAVRGAGAAIPDRPRPTLLASLEAAPPPVASAPRFCAVGPHFVQVGAFGDTARVRAAAIKLDGLDALRAEPAFVNGKAVVRVRLGPTADRGAAERLLGQVRARGYEEAALVPVRAGGPTARC